MYDAYETGLRAYHARQNLSKKQDDVCEFAGISQATYSRFESGQSDIPLSKAVKICECLNISIAWLVGEKSMPRLTETEQLDVENYIRFLINKRK